MAESYAVRIFLFLQEPQAPFYALLARQLRAAGARTLRVGFDRGDEVFWPHGDSYIAQTDDLAGWPARITALLRERGATDLVLLANRRYAAVRPQPSLSAAAEFRLYVRRLAMMPLHAPDRLRTTAQSRRAAFPTNTLDTGRQAARQHLRLVR